MYTVSEGDVAFLFYAASARGGSGICSKGSGLAENKENGNLLRAIGTDDQRTFAERTYPFAIGISNSADLGRADR